MSEALHQNHEESTGNIEAYTNTPTNATIRLRGVETDDGWVEKVEVVSGADVMSNGRAKVGEPTVQILFEGQGLRASQVYNQTIQPYIRAELEAAREIMDEAAEQGDTIRYMAQKEYIADLEEQLA